MKGFFTGLICIQILFSLPSYATNNENESIVNNIAIVAHFLPKTGDSDLKKWKKSLETLKVMRPALPILTSLEKSGIEFYPYVPSGHYPNNLNYSLYIDFKKSPQFVRYLLKLIRLNEFRSLLKENWNDLITAVNIKTIQGVEDYQKLVTLRIKAVSVNTDQNRKDVFDAFLKEMPGAYSLARAQSISKGNYIQISPALYEPFSDMGGHGFFCENSDEIKILHQVVENFLAGGTAIEKLEDKIRNLYYESQNPRPLDESLIERAANLINTKVFKTQNFLEFYGYLKRYSKESETANRFVMQLESYAENLLTVPDLQMRRNAFSVYIKTQLEKVHTKQITFLTSSETLSSYLLDETDSEIIRLILNSIQIEPVEFTEANIDNELILAGVIISRVKPHRKYLDETHHNWLNHSVNIEHLKHQASSLQHPSGFSFVSVVALRLLRHHLDFFSVDSEYLDFLINRERSLYVNFVEYDQKKVKTHPQQFSELVELQKLLNAIATEKITCSKTLEKKDVFFKK